MPGPAEYVIESTWRNQKTGKTYRHYVKKVYVSVAGLGSGLEVTGLDDAMIFGKGEAQRFLRLNRLNPAKYKAIPLSKAKQNEEGA